LVAAFGLAVEGVHFHLGFGARHANAYTESVQYVCDLCTRQGLTPSYIDCGGGLEPGNDSALADFQNAVRYARTIFPAAATWAEHGRYLTHSSTALVCGVVDVKNRNDCRYLICDGGRTNHALAADAGMHPLLALPQRHGRLVLTTITGATCMTDDRLGRVVLPNDVGPGDVIVWFNAGAYHLPWETRFSHGVCAVVWCDSNDEMSLARSRETPDEWGRLWKS
jgi:diaminopimelate decarboxylase